MISMMKAATPRLADTEQVADKVVAEAAVESTHALARRMIEHNEIALQSPHGIPITVLMADQLAKALVRFGRTWVTLQGRSFTATCVAVIPESVADDELVNGWLQMIAGLATLDALEGTIDAAGARPFDPECGFQIKWPNDIYCHGLKIGATVTEVLPLGESASAAVATDGRPASMAVVFSVGVNLNMPADRLPTAQATSLQMHFGPLPSVAELRDMIASRLVESLRSRLAALVAMPMIQAGRLRSEMRHVCWMMGRTIHAQLIDGSSVRGEVIALNDDASLSVRTLDGGTRALLSSEVSLLD